MKLYHRKSSSRKHFQLFHNKHKELEYKLLECKQLECNSSRPQSTFTPLILKYSLPLYSSTSISISPSRLLHLATNSSLYINKLRFSLQQVVLSTINLTKGYQRSFNRCFKTTATFTVFNNIS